VLIVFANSNAQFFSALEQNKIYKTFLDTSSKNKRVLKFLLPYFTLDPQTSVAFGFNMNFIFKTDTLNSRASNVYFNSSYSLKKQLSLLITHTVFSKNENWLFKGRINYLDFPLTVYQIGNRTQPESAEIIYSQGFLWYQKILRTIAPSVFLGLQYRIYFMQNIHSQYSTAWFETTKPLGYSDFLISGLGLNLRFDNRNNTQTTTKGLFLDVSLYDYQKSWGSEYNFGTLDVDFRYFRPLFKNKKPIWAFWSYQSYSYGQVVWQELPQTGLFGTTRGYVKGRYRDDYFLAFENELRFPLFWRFWGVSFLGISTVQKNKVFPKKWNPSGGLGLRFLLKNKEQIFTGIDFAWGVQQNKGIYMRLGQAF